MRRPVASGAAKPKIKRENEITRQVIAILDTVGGDREVMCRLLGLEFDRENLGR
jgi:hypothetical protein